MNQQEKATLLRNLHKKGDPLVLVNAWDAASARIFEEAGSKAIATTSAGLAQSLGYPDGQKLPWKELVEALRRIVRVVRLPVTTDIEAGYADSEDELQRNIEELIDAGAVGLNLEDAIPGDKKKLYSLGQQTARIKTVRQAANGRGIPLVINARTDTYWIGAIQPEESRIQQTIERGRAYLRAGADCIFIPGASDLRVIAQFVEQIVAPINILAVKGAPSIVELARAGVARVSVGSGVFRAAYTKAKQAAEQALHQGAHASFTESAIPYPEFNRLFEP